MFRLKEIRLECGLKRSKLAEELNMNAGTIANYENEIRQAPYECLIKFADYFDVSIDYLLGRSDGETPLKNASLLNAEETAIIAGYRALSKTGKNRVEECIELWQKKDNV